MSFLRRFLPVLFVGSLLLSAQPVQTQKRVVNPEDLPSIVYVFLLDVSKSMEDPLSKGEKIPKRIRVKEMLEEFVKKELYQPGAKVAVFVSVFSTTGPRATLAEGEDDLFEDDLFVVAKPDDTLSVLRAIEAAYGRKIVAGLTCYRDAVDNRMTWATTLKGWGKQVVVYVLTDGDDTASKMGKPEFCKRWSMVCDRTDPLCVLVDLTERRTIDALRIVSASPGSLNLDSFLLTGVQKRSVSFSHNIPGWQYKVAVEGDERLKVSPAQVPIQMSPTELVFTGNGELPENGITLVLTPLRADPGAKGYDLNKPSLPLRIQRVVAPSLKFPLLVDDRLTLLKGAPAEIVAETDASAERVEWEWNDGAAKRTAQGTRATVKFDQVGEYPIAVRAVSKHRKQDGTALETSKTVRASVIEMGANFEPVPSPVWLDQQPTRIGLKTFGDPKSVVVNAEETSYTLKPDQKEVSHRFTKAGQHTVVADVSRDANKVQNKLTVNVLAPPTLAIEEPLGNAQFQSDTPVRFAIGDAAAFKDVMWTIAGEKVPGVSVLYRFPKQGAQAAAVEAKAAAGGDRVFRAEVKFVIQDPPRIVIGKPANYAYVNTGEDQEFEVRNADDFKDGSITWEFTIAAEPVKTVTKTGRLVSHRWLTEGDWTVQVTAVAKDDRPANPVRLTIFAQQPVKLQIKDPAANSKIYLGCETLFAIDSPEKFKDIEWVFPDGQKQSGEQVKHTFAEGSGPCTVTITGKPLTKGAPQSASREFELVLPQLQIVKPAQGVKVVLGKPFEVEAQPEPASFLFKETSWAFTTKAGKKLQPKSGVGGTFVIDNYEGECVATVQGTVEVGGKLLVTPPTSHDFRVELGGAHLVAAPKKDQYRYDEQIVFRLVFDDPNVQSQKTAWDFGDGTTVPATAGHRLQSPHVYGRTGTFKVGTTFTTNDAAHEITTNVTTSARPLKPPHPTVFSEGAKIEAKAPPTTKAGAGIGTAGGKVVKPSIAPKRESELELKISRGEKDWRRVVRLENMEKDCDVTKSEWSWQFEPAGKKSVASPWAPVSSPDAFEVSQLGTYRFNLMVTGVPDQAGKAETISGKTALVVRRVFPWGLFLGIVGLVAAVVLPLAFVYFTRNGCIEYRLFVSVAREPQNILRDDAAMQRRIGFGRFRVGDYWSKWIKTATIPMHKVCRGEAHWANGAGKLDSVVVQRDGRYLGIDFSKRNMLKEVSVLDTALRAWVLSDPRWHDEDKKEDAVDVQGEALPSRKVLFMLEKRPSSAWGDKLWILGICVSLALFAWAVHWYLSRG